MAPALLALNLALAPALAAGFDYDATLARGWEARRGGDNIVALAAFAEILERFPDDTDALVGRGYSRFATGDVEGAGEDFLRVLELAPDYTDAEKGLKLVEARLQQKEEPEAAAEDPEPAAPAPRPEPPSPPPPPPPPLEWDGTGDLPTARSLLKRGRVEDALVMLDGLIATRPDDNDLHLFRGFALRRLGKRGEAEASFRRVVEANPSYGDAWLGLAVVLNRPGRRREAMEAVDIAAGLQPTNPDVQIQRAWILNDTGRPGASLQALRQARELGASQEDVDQARLDMRRGAYGRYWQAQTYRENLDWDSGRADWDTRSLMLTRKVDGGSTGLEHREVTRFGRTDHALGLDVYRMLWAGAYGNFRMDWTSSATVLPKLEYLADIYQDLGNGWEGMLGWSRREVPGEDVDSYRIQIGRYVDEWYLRYRLQLTPVAGTTGSAHAFIARRFLGSVDDFLEATVGFGEEATEVAAGPTIVRRDNDYAVLRYQTFLDEHLGLFAVGSISHYDRLPDFKSLSVGVMYRWW
jgi:YaiO family outer membrane protein